MKTHQQHHNGSKKPSIKVLEMKFGQEEKEAEMDGGGVNPWEENKSRKKRGGRTREADTCRVDFNATT